MRGFEDSAASVYIKLDPVLGYGSAAIALDPGAFAELTSDGLTVDVGGVRHWVPSRLILELTQEQGVAAAPASEPIQQQPTPPATPPKSD